MLRSWPLVVLLAIGLARASAASAGEIIVEGPMPGGMSAEFAAPPWHGSIQRAECGPWCPPPTLFHADPCGQLGMFGPDQPECLQRPPLFPRLQALWAYGSMPTPPPPALPRCHRCGAPIEGGF